MTFFDSLLNIEQASAHCDIPCGIYDPITAQIAALTCVRMIDQMADVVASDHTPEEKSNSFGRMTGIKEKHAEAVKHEIRVIWGDFFKAPHIEQFPQIHGLTHQIMQLSSAVKQGIKREDAVKLVEKVNEFAEIFWQIKGEETITAPAPYAPGLPLTYRKVS